jgi:hypothetical protein
MRRHLKWKPWMVPIAGLLLLYPATVLAGAKEDLSIAPNGSCSAGGTAFTITNTNSGKSIHATVTQSQVVSGQTTVTTLDMTLQPGQQQQLGCSPRSSAGNFLVTWQVQSAQYQ